MTSSANSLSPAAPRAVSARIDDDRLIVLVADGREIAVPLAAFDFLRQATEAEVKDVRLIGGGEGLWWSSLEEGVATVQLFGLPADAD